MHVTFWGTRGSIAKAGPTTIRYGGNTSCVEIGSSRGSLIVVDGGTGAHGLGQDLVRRFGDAPISGHILISHTHWDHIQGLPFFEPLFRPDDTWRIYGPTGLVTSLGDTLSGQMQYNYFPVSIDQLGGVVDYHDLVEGSFDIDDVRITTHYLNHPALTLAYRIEADGATVVYASDHEPHHRALAHGGDLDTNRHDSAHARFIAGADLLIHDAQYCAAEYDDRVGWGHSTVEYVVDVARHAGVARLALYHHDPNRTDDDVDELLELARAHASVCGFEGEILAAAEGMRIELTGTLAGGGGGGGGGGSGGVPFTATDTPALEEIRRTVLIAVDDPEIEATLTRAAEAEQCDIWIADDREALLELAAAHDPAIVLLEESIVGDGTVSELVGALRELDRPSGADVSVVVIGGSGVRPGLAGDKARREWMVWPASAVYVRTKLRAWLLRRACRWQNAPRPPDEAERLRTLHSLDVLDTEPEERFDRITAEASEALDVPVALVSLVDENRQWFKSHHGLDATETPRDVSLCAHAILEDGVFQVPDARADLRFADNPLVAGDPHLRFYAGVPLTMSDGTRAGTLCVVDYRPRLLDDQQLTELRRLADRAATELESSG